MLAMAPVVTAAALLAAGMGVAYSSETWLMVLGAGFPVTLSLPVLVTGVGFAMLEQRFGGGWRWT